VESASGYQVFRDFITAPGQFHLADVTQEALQLIRTREAAAFQDCFESLFFFSAVVGCL
jgi:hypothetical protein